MRHFSDKMLDELYRALLFNPPTRFVEHKGLSYRKTGSGIYFPFWVGYDRFDKSCPYEAGTKAYASWAAGVDYRKLGGRDYPKNK